MRFHEAAALGEGEVAELQEVVRQRVLALFKRRAILGNAELARKIRLQPVSCFSTGC